MLIFLINSTKIRLFLILPNIIVDNLLIFQNSFIVDNLLNIYLVVSKIIVHLCPKLTIMKKIILTAIVLIFLVSMFGCGATRQGCTYNNKMLYYNGR